MHREGHYIQRAGWLRAAVLGANDGIISISALMVGIAAASSSQENTLMAGIAGLVSGALSMAAGEYVSVSSQSDLEEADLNREKKELAEAPRQELQELTDIYIKRGVEPNLARQVAEQMTHKDALMAHAREELGLSELTTARPLQAALSSAGAFSAGGIFPILFGLLISQDMYVYTSSALSVTLLGLLGVVSARLSGTPPMKPTLRIMLWGAGAMGATALIGHFISLPAGV